MRKLFTERHGQGKPRTAEILDDATKTGLLGLVSSLIDQDWFGLSFPAKCPDGTANAGCDTHSLRTMMAGWERLKTLEAAADKKTSVKILLDKGAAESTFRQVLEDEAVRLTLGGQGKTGH